MNERTNERRRFDRLDEATTAPERPLQAQQSALRSTTREALEGSTRSRQSNRKSDQRTNRHRRPEVDCYSRSELQERSTEKKVKLVLQA
jgi:hypothetical protein